MPLSDREWYASCNNLLVAHSSAFKFFYYTWTKPFLHLLHPLKFHKIIVNHFSGNRIHRCKTNGDVFFFRSSMVGQLNAVWLNPVKRNIKITLPWAMYFIGYRLVIFFNLHEKIPIVALPQRPTPSLGDFIWTLFFVVFMAAPFWLNPRTHFLWSPIHNSNQKWSFKGCQKSFEKSKRIFDFEETIWRERALTRGRLRQPSVAWYWKLEKDSVHSPNLVLIVVSYTW